MMIISGKVWKSLVTVVVLVVIFGRWTCAAVTESMCPSESITESIFGFRDQICVVLDGLGIATGSSCFFGVKEGDEVFLQKTLSLVNKNGSEYLSVLFYASWCPFSKSFRQYFALLSALYPSIPHFAVEESSIKPSTLSKYSVHGFPALFLLNSTMRVRYHGSRTVGPLVAFYSDVTGFKLSALDIETLDKIIHSTKQEKKHANDNEQENCPFSWARSPENMFRHETYLALASVFVILRLLYLVYPALLANVQFIWRGYIQNVRLRSFSDHPRAYLNQGMQLFSSLQQPCKRSTLQEGAMSAGAWASKSLTTVSIGEASSSRSVAINESH